MKKNAIFSLEFIPRTLTAASPTPQVANLLDHGGLELIVQHGADRRHNAGSDALVIARKMQLRQGNERFRLDERLRESERLKEGMS